jgi:exodeoxyribonuclease-3
LICGDLNVAREERDVHPKERKANQIGTRADERTLFAELLATGLTDVGRALDPDNDALFTWWPPWRQLRQRNIGWRIDYLLAGDGLAARARTAVSRREFGTSDHAPVVATFETAPGATPALQP